MTTNPSVKKKETQKLKEMSNEENNKRQDDADQRFFKDIEKQLKLSRFTPNR